MLHFHMIRADAAKYAYADAAPDTPMLRYATPLRRQRYMAAALMAADKHDSVMPPYADAAR